MIKTFINWILYIAVLCINAMASILPINGYNTGEISAFYPNYFVPAGFTFSIWGVIYLFFLNYSIAHTYFSIKKEKNPLFIKWMDEINPWYWATCILNILWILSWHYLHIHTSVVIMLAFLFVLIQIFIINSSYKNQFSKTNCFFLLTPFNIYIGWISVATIANISALLVYVNWGGLGIDPQLWALIMIAIAILLAFWFSYFNKIITAPIVIAWALWGIMHAKGGKIPMIHSISMIGIWLILILSFRLFTLKYIFK